MVFASGFSFNEEPQIKRYKMKTLRLHPFYYLTPTPAFLCICPGIQREVLGELKQNKKIVLQKVMTTFVATSI